MSSICPVATPGATSLAAEPPAVTASEAGPSLLPAPCAEGFSGDPMSDLYLFESQDQDLTTASAASRVEGLQTERTHAFESEQQAIRNEDAAISHKSFWDELGSVFGDVAKVAGVVASIASVVCTFGASTPVAALAIAGAVLSSASMADGEFSVLQKLGVDPSCSRWIDLGMFLGGAATSLGASLFAGARAAEQASGLVDRVAEGVAGAATMAQGATEIEEGGFQAQEDRASADEVASLFQASRSLRALQFVLDEAEASDHASSRIKSLLVSIKSTQDATVTDAATAVKG